MSDSTLCQTLHFAPTLARNRHHHTQERYRSPKAPLAVHHPPATSLSQLVDQDCHYQMLHVAWRRPKCIWQSTSQVTTIIGRLAIDLVLQKELNYDLSARTLYNLALMENDPTACCDRTIPSLVMISLCAYRVPEEIFTS